MGTLALFVEFMEKKQEDRRDSMPETKPRKVPPVCSKPELKGAMQLFLLGKLNRRRSAKIRAKVSLHILSCEACWQRAKSSPPANSEQPIN